MAQKGKGLSTSLPKEIIPDSELKCMFCKRNNNQADMSHTASKSSNGNISRWAYHRICMAEYKKKKRRKQKDNKASISEDFINTELDALKLKQTAFRKLLKSLDCHQ